VSGISIATIRKIEQGAIGTRPRRRGLSLRFERAGLQLISQDPDGGAGVRWKEREMNEQMREYFKLKNRIKVWFIYNHGLKDDEDLDYMIDEVTLLHEARQPIGFGLDPCLVAFNIATTLTCCRPGKARRN
jgi:hypothetical protein